MYNDTIENYVIYKNHKNKLGKGSFSSVYRAKYEGVTNKYFKKGDIVAVKIINTLGLNYREFESVNNEIAIMNMLKDNPHKNVVKCLDTVQTGKNAYIIMELCDCGDLTCVMTARPIEENVVKMYFRQLISGLQFLHGHKLIHRDIKPKNILLMDNKKVLKIADFGFAKIVREQLIKERMCGSPLYMAPEIMNNDVYNDQSDLWSVGMILFEMLYGYHPFGDCNTLTELKMLVNTDNILVPPLDMDHIVVSELCKDLLKKLLQRQTNLRIGWEDFFNNMWTNVDEDDVNDDIDEEIDNRPKTKALNINIPKNIQNNTPESYNTPDSIIKIMHSNINIVENYYYTDNSPVVKINNHITSSCIFEMEFNDDYKVKKIVL